MFKTILYQIKVLIIWEWKNNGNSRKLIIKLRPLGRLETTVDWEKWGKSVSLTVKEIKWLGVYKCVIHQIHILCGSNIVVINSLSVVMCFLSNQK